MPPLFIIEPEGEGQFVNDRKRSVSGLFSNPLAPNP